MKKIVALFFVSLIALMGFAGCGNSDNTVVVASKPHTEQYILGEMISQLIEEKTDLTVERSFGIGGGTSNIHPGMVSGEIDIYPEYTGTAWLFVLKETEILGNEDMYEAVRDAYLEEYNIEWLGLYGFNNTYCLATTEAIAGTLPEKNYSELAKVSDQYTFGAEYDFYEREDGYPGLVETYGFNFKDTKEIDIGLKYQAIAGGEVDVINAFSTDGLIKENNLVVLDDDKSFFPSYEAGTLIRKETLDAHPELGDVLKLLNNQISDEEMREMNYEVESKGADPAVVAKDFLVSKGLL